MTYLPLFIFILAIPVVFAAICLYSNCIDRRRLKIDQRADIELLPFYDRYWHPWRGAIDEESNAASAAMSQAQRSRDSLEAQSASDHDGGSPEESEEEVINIALCRNPASPYCRDEDASPHSRRRSQIHPRRKETGSARSFWEENSGRSSSYSPANEAQKAFQEVPLSARQDSLVSKQVHFTGPGERPLKRNKYSFSDTSLPQFIRSARNSRLEEGQGRSLTAARVVRVGGYGGFDLGEDAEKSN
jgi:hypothetical protein